MSDAKELIAEEVVNMAERIEALEDPHDDYIEDPLEVKVLAGIDGQPREIYIVLTVGGPHLEVALYSKTAQGSWAMEEHSCHINDDSGVLDYWADYYTDYWEDNVIC